MARIDDQHEEIRMNERKRLEEQTRQRRIDGELQLKIDNEASRLADEHKSRLEESHRQDRINETIVSGIEAQAEALASEHREMRLSEARQIALSTENRKRIDEEVAALEKEHRDRLEAQHHQGELDEEIRKRIDDEADQVRQRHKEIHRAEAQLRMDTAMLSSSIEGMDVRMHADEMRIHQVQQSVGEEQRRAQHVEALIKAHQKAQERTQAARDSHIEAQLAQDEEQIQKQAAEVATLKAAEDAIALCIRETKAEAEKKVVDMNAMTTAPGGVANFEVPAAPFLSQQSSIAGYSAQSTFGGGSTQMRRNRKAVSIHKSDDSLAKAINTFTNAAREAQQNITIPTVADIHPTNARGNFDFSSVSENRSSYLRKAKSHSPPRSRRGVGDEIHMGMSRRQRLRAEAVNQSMESYAIGKRSRVRLFRGESKLVAIRRGLTMLTSNSSVMSRPSTMVLYLCCCSCC